MDECIHGMNPDWCAVCLHPPGNPKPRPAGPVFKARFPGWCTGCTLPISPGQEVRKWSDDEYRHATTRPGDTGCQP